MAQKQKELELIEADTARKRQKMIDAAEIIHGNSNTFFIDFLNGNRSVFKVSEVRLIENSLLKLTLLNGDERLIPFSNVQCSGFITEE